MSNSSAKRADDTKVHQPSGGFFGVSRFLSEAHCSRNERDVLRFGDPKEALHLLAERPERTSQSALYGYEAKAHIALSQYAEAERVLQNGLAAMQEAPNRGRQAELSWLLSQVAEAQQNRAEADTWLARAEVITAQIADPLALLQVLLQRALLRRQGDLPGESIAPIRKRLSEQLRAMPVADWHRERSLSGAAAIVLGPGYANLFVDVICEVGFGTLAATAAEMALKTMMALLPISLNLASPVEQLLRIVADAGKLPEILPALDPFLANIPMSLGAANLAGIEDYREAWEREISSEAV